MESYTASTLQFISSVPMSWWITAAGLQCIVLYVGISWLIDYTEDVRG